MSFKYQGDSTLGVSLTMQTPKPLDTRLVVDTRNDLYTIPARYAYNGMAVVCIADGNIYTLLDKNHITEQIGWKASYESIQIIICTEEEYKKWKANTTDDFTAIDEDQTWLHQDTYYYIYEDSIADKGQYYVSQKQFEDLTNRLNNKVNISDLDQISKKLDTELVNIANTYATKQELQESINTINNQLDTKVNTTDLETNYYTKLATDDKFVTKESLRGDGVEGDDFVFVTQNQYNKDKEQYNQDLTTKLSTKIDQDTDASLTSLTTKTIKYGDTNLVLSEGKVSINGNIVADNMYDIVCIPHSEYQELVKNNQLKEDTYYFTYGEDIDDSGYITKANLDYKYLSKEVCMQYIDEQIDQKVEERNIIIDDETLVLGTS